MKFLLLIFFFLSGQALYAQIVATKDNVEEYNLFYSDTANGEFAYGDYEPKDMIKLDDGSLLIGTELAISFPSEYKTSGNYDSTWFARFKVYTQKSHISTGTVLKLNSSFKKEWEVFFKDKRVEKILRTSNGRVLVVGGEVLLKSVWLAEIDTSGKLLWEKHYKYKNQVTVADALIDGNDDIYLLLQASHIIPVEIRRYEGRRNIRFFKDSETNSRLALLKITAGGKKKWLKTIDANGSYDKYGYHLVSDGHSVFASYTRSGPLRGDQVAQFSASGKKISTKSILNQNVLLFKTGLVTVTSHSKGKLFIYESGKAIDSTLIQSAHQDVRIEGSIYKSNGYLILASNHENKLDYLLINLRSDLKFGSYWVYPREEYNEVRGAVILDNGETVIVGKCYREMSEGANKLAAYINIVKIKDGF